MKTLIPHQSEMIAYLSEHYNLNCVIFAPIYVAGTFEALDFLQLSEIREISKLCCGLDFAICARERTFAFIVPQH